MAFTYLKVKSTKCFVYFRWSWSCYFGLGHGHEFGLVDVTDVYACLCVCLWHKESVRCRQFPVLHGAVQKLPRESSAHGPQSTEERSHVDAYVEGWFVVMTLQRRAF